MAQITRPFGTVLTAMVTPFSEDGSLDVRGLRQVVEHLLDLGHDGIVVNGTTGEAPTTSDAEKRQIIEVTKAVAGDKAMVVAGVGTNDTAHTVALAKQAADAGADGLLVVSPYYSRPSQPGLIQHFLRAADATDLPVMIYDIPFRSAVNLEMTTLEELSHHDRIVAVKDATGNLGRAFGVMNLTGLAYYSGDDVLNLPMLTIGGAGVVSVVGHVLGAELCQIAAAVNAGDLTTARAVAAKSWPVVGAVMGGGQGACMIKAALEVMGVLPNRVVRLPLFKASESEVSHVRKALLTAGHRPTN